MSSKKIDELEGLLTVTRMRERHSHVLTDRAKIEQVKTLATNYQALVRATAHSYWSTKYLPLVLNNPYSIITTRRRNGESQAYPLPSGLQGQAILDGLDVVRASWRQTFAAVRSKAARRFPDTVESIIDEQGQTQANIVQNPLRHEINWLLCWPELLVQIMNGEVVYHWIRKVSKSRNSWLTITK